MNLVTLVTFCVFIIVVYIKFSQYFNTNLYINSSNFNGFTYFLLPLNIPPLLYPKPPLLFDTVLINSSDLYVSQSEHCLAENLLSL